MSNLVDLAIDHQRRRLRLTNRVTAAALRQWRQIDPAFLDAGWDAFAPAIVSTVTAGQVTAARQSSRYLNGVASVYGGAEAASVVPEAFGGVMLDGREVGPALFGAVAGTKTAIGRGVAPARAFEVGASFLATLIGAAVQDMGRQSDNTLAAGRGWTRYVRVVSAGACSRCAILAGKAEYKKAFLRHPRCKCTAMPIEGDNSAPVPKGFFESPDDYFESLSASEQDRVFTKAGAWAIREGADPIAVVNARRGALNAGGVGGAPSRMVKTVIGRKADGSPLEVYLTGEGTTIRGAFGRNERRLTNELVKTGRYRRTTTVRLMPESILKMGEGNPERTRALLQKYGYLN